MASTRCIKKQKGIVDPSLVFKLIEGRPAFQGAPELEALLTRSQTAENLEKAGFPVSAKTLATKASRGGGPPYSLFGPRPLYSWRGALVWAHSRLTPPRRNSSEGDSGARDVISEREDSTSIVVLPPSESDTQGSPNIRNDTLTNERSVLPARKRSVR